MRPANPRNVRELIGADGISHYGKWLKSLDVKVRARVQARVLRFETGNLGDHKSVGKGVWEARLDFGPGYRIYFGFEGDEIILLIGGGEKKSQRKDIAVAQKLWNEETGHE